MYFKKKVSLKSVKYFHIFQDVGHDVNLIGQNLEAEMFRHHVSTLIYLGFINNINQMVTVDMNGSINIWRYDL